MEETQGKLYIVATPIGNLGDMTFRAIDILKTVDLIACEDTRVTSKLLHHYAIDTKTISYHQHTNDDKAQRIILDIMEGKNVAVVTDAGTPGISDPGNKLVAQAIEKNIRIEPIPGTSALGAMVSVAGIDLQKFIFLAYPPHKKGRQTFFQRVLTSDVPVIYYDSVHRVIKNLQLLQELSNEEVQVIVGRELTKMHEEIVRGSVMEILSYYEEHSDRMRGEFVVIVKR